MIKNKGNEGNRTEKLLGRVAQDNSGDKLNRLSNSSVEIMSAAVKGPLANLFHAFDDC